jgi:hypothetical protein
MSASVPEENNELARVLNRINTLIGQADLQERPVVAADIPQLTEVYEGESLLFAARSAAEFTALGKVADKGFADHTESPTSETVETLLAEMLPAIQSIIRKGVLQQLEDSEQPLCAKLEMEIMQSLRENLQSRLS